MFSFLFPKKNNTDTDDNFKSNLLENNCDLLENKCNLLENNSDLQSVYFNVLDKKTEYLDDLSFYKLNNKYSCMFKIIFIYTHKNNKTETLNLNADYYEYNDKFYIHKSDINFKPQHKKGKIDLCLDIYLNEKFYRKYEVKFNFRINKYSKHLLENICIDNSRGRKKLILTLEKDINNEYYFSELKYISY